MKNLDNHYEIMVKGNTYIKNLAEMTNMTRRDFRAKLFKKPFNKDEWALTDEQFNLFTEVIPHIQAVRNIENEMLQAFAPLATKRAIAWFKRVYGTMADVEDYKQEALLALLDAIYGYTQKETKFITYAWNTIYHRLIQIGNKNNYFSSITNEAIELLQRFDKARDKMNCHFTDQDVYDICNFTKEEINIIQDTRVKIINASQMENDENTETFADYTANRRGIDQEKDTVPCNYDIIENLNEAVKKTDLNYLERAVVEASMTSSWGWKTEIANKLINPSTKKPFSKTMIDMILKNAVAKLRDTYRKVA